MSNVRFERKFATKAKTDFKAYVNLELPIQPFLGMRIKKGNVELKIVEIVFDSDKDLLVIRADTHMDHARDPEAIKKELRNADWKIEGEEEVDEDEDETPKEKRKGKGKKKKDKEVEEDEEEKEEEKKEEDKEEEEDKDEDEDEEKKEDD